MSNKFIHQGRKSYKNSKAFKRKKHEITKKVNEKYRELMSHEKSIIKKNKLLLNKKKELKKELEIIDSKHILFSKSEQ